MNRRKNASINDINELFVDACENGDYQTVAKILEAIKDFNIDVTDNLGRSALRLSVENEHLEVVRILLNKSDAQKLREALLLAIYLGHIQIAELILKHPNYKIMNDKKFKGDDAFWQTPSSDDAQFSPDITPIILASQYKRTEIVQILLLDGNRIIKPHEFQCKCKECSNKFKFDSLRHAQSRLNAYRGLCSESYISLASVDPLQTAFELGYEMKLLAEKEKYFKNEYLQLRENLSVYSVKLLSNVRGRDELEIILDKTGKEDEEKYARLSRIDLALKYEEKRFVAHPSCQQKLVEIWYSGIRNISKMNLIIVIPLFFLFVILLPFICIIHIIAPDSKAGKFISQPSIKFMAHTISYLFFVGMVIVSSLTLAEDQKNRERFSHSYPNFTKIFADYSSNSHLRYRFPVHDFYFRMQNPGYLDFVINIWIIAFFWYEAKKLYQYGFKQYVLVQSNLFNFCMVIFYILSYGLRYYTLIMTGIKKDQIWRPSFWRKVSMLHHTDYNAQVDVLETFYWLNDDRFYWNAYDPMFLADGLFAVANIFSFIRFIFILPAIQSLGPLQITLGKMISDIVKFTSIFLIIFASFVVGLNNIFWYYQSNVRNSVEVVNHKPGSTNVDITNAEKSFSSIQKTIGTTFWALFGLSDGHEAGLSAVYDNLITEDVGSIIFGAFHISAIVILLNMLIAMMTKSYERIREDSDIEWKYARSKLYLEYIKGDINLPPPFNLIPTTSAWIWFFKFIFYRKSKSTNNNLCDRPCEQTLSTSNRNKSSDKNGAIRRTSIGGNDLTYIKVVQRIVKRYLLRHQKDDEEINERDIEELKQDLQMMRYEIRNDLTKSKSNAVKSVGVIHSGLAILGDQIMKKTENPDLSRKYENFKCQEYDLKDSIGLLKN